MRKIILTIALVAGFIATAQVKVGNNPTTLATNAKFQVEGATTSDQFVVLNNGSVGIGTTAPNSSSILDLTSTTKGLLPPIMTTTQRDVITTPATGLVIFNSTANKMQFNSGTPAAPVWSDAAATAEKNIYTDNGTLAGNRVVTTGGNSLNFTGTSGSVAINNTTEANVQIMANTAAGAGLMRVGNSSNYIDEYISGTSASFKSSNGVTGLSIGTGGSAPLNLLTNNINQVTILASGNVGVGTTAPAAGAIVEINSASKGLLLPRVANTAAVTAPVNGMIIYDISSNCIKGYENNAWSDCYGAVPASVVASCGGFSGTYNINQPLSSSPSTCQYSVTLTNNSFSTSTIALQTADLVLSGVSGYAVSSVKIAGTVVSSVTLTSGQIATIDYIITGTCATTGTLTGVWNKLSLTCTSTTPVTSNVWVSGLTCGSGVFAPAGDFVQGVAYTGTLTIPYTGGNGLAYPSQTITSSGITGFTAVLRAGTLTNNLGGNLVFDVTGTTSITTGTGGYTPSGATTGADFVINFGSKTCTITNIVIPNFEIVYNIDYGSSFNGAIFNSTKTLSSITSNSAGYVSSDYFSGTNSRFPYKGTYTINYAARPNIYNYGVVRWDNKMSSPITGDIDVDAASGSTGPARTFTATGVTVGSTCASWLQACSGCSPNTYVDYNSTPASGKKLTIKLISHN